MFHSQRVCLSQIIVIVIADLRMNVRGNKNNSAYMEKAIDKASKLIELLTKENEDLKIQLEKYQEQYPNGEDLLEKIQGLEKQLQTKDAEIQKLNRKLGEIQRQAEQKSKKNRALHEKISDLSHKNQQNLKNLEKQKKKNLALDNENQYLLKTHTIHQAKQNTFHNSWNQAEDHFRRQIALIDRTKTAFSRKCEEMKCENVELRKQIYQLTAINKQLETILQQKLQQSTNFKQLDCEVRRTNEALSYIIESTLKVKAETGLYLKVQQIKNYLTYRLQHIEKLIKPITDLLGDQTFVGEEGAGRNLQQLSTLACRLSSYLADLTK